LGFRSRKEKKEKMEEEEKGEKRERTGRGKIKMKREKLFSDFSQSQNRS